MQQNITSNEQLPSIINQKQQTIDILGQKLKENYSEQRVFKDQQSYIKKFLQSQDNQGIRINIAKPQIIQKANKKCELLTKGLIDELKIRLESDYNFSRNDVFMISKKNFENLLHFNAQLDPSGFSSMWLQQRDKLRSLKKQEKIELRNQSRQVFQKLIDECNQKINPRPNLLVVNEQEDQQHQHHEILSQKLVDENNFITQFDESAMNVVQNVKQFVQKSKNIVDLLEKKEEKENQDTFSLYLQKDLIMNLSQDQDNNKHQNDQDNNKHQNVAEQNSKQMFPQVHQTQKQLRSMTHQQKVTKTNFDFQQTYNLDLQKKKNLDRTKNSTGSLNPKKYASNSTTNLINAYKQKQMQQYQNLNFKLQSLKNKQNLLLVETKRDK